jgi:hypothetical protein
MDKISVCKNYYQRLLTKDTDGIEMLFVDQAVVSSPMDEVSGLTDVVKAAKSFSANLELMEITQSFEKDHDVVLVYVFKLFGVTQKGVSIFTLSDDLKIEKINLFYDTHPFRVKREEIFG